jgi:hypothetical protein
MINNYNWCIRMENQKPEIKKHVLSRKVIRFFEKNQDAHAAHIVLGEIFSNAIKASSYRKQINAKRVLVITRDELNILKDEGAKE